MALHKKISQIVEKMPEKAAIEYGSIKVTYREMEDKAEQIANFFAGQTLENKRILLFLDKSPDLIETILGILKYGGIFVPLDTRYPLNRISSIMEEVQSTWIVLHFKDLTKINQLMEQREDKIRLNVLVLDQALQVSESFTNLNIFYLNEKIASYQEHNEKLCYIYFTSGSTGRPKGILGRHSSLQHFIAWEIEEFQLTDQLRSSQFTSPSFDPFLRDIFIPLCVGGTLCIPENDEIILQSEQLINWIDQQRISLIHMTPSLFKTLSSGLTGANIFQNLQYVLLAGEQLRGNDIKKFMQIFKDRIQLVNIYGPTETTLAKVFYRIQESDSKRNNIPVGKPIDHTQVLVLNKDLKICETGQVGEVYIRTPYMSAGYFNRPELTREVFFRDLFKKNPKDLFYKTGDLGKILPDGNLELVGRSDFQVKIRGVRIEPAEIENKLLAYPQIQEAVVVAKEGDNCEKYLTVYYVGDGKVSTAELREHLTLELPEYMIPGYFTPLPAMPLTSSGKIDRKALLSFEDGRSLVEYVAPTTEVEKKIIRIWSEVLRKEQIGIKDNFFEIGGHSLKAASVVARISQELNLDLPLREIFKNPTVQQLAERISKLQKNIYVPLEPVAVRAFYQLSAAQFRVFMVQKLDTASISYNITSILTIEGELDVKRVEESFAQLIQRHESLRTSFQMIDGEAVQIIHSEIDFKIHYIDVGQDLLTDEEIKIRSREFIQPFDLAQAPLLRVELIRYADKYLFMYDMHHIISDATSHNILINEFIRLYQGEKLPELKIQYKDYAVWQNDSLSEDTYTQERYWLERLKDFQYTELPPDVAFDEESLFGQKSIVLGAELFQQIAEYCSRHQVTRFHFFMAVFKIILAKMINQRDLAIGIPVAGRNRVELENLIGLFINLLVIRSKITKGMTFSDYLEQIKEVTMEAFQNQNYSFDQLDLKLKEKYQHQGPLFSIVFNYLPVREDEEMEVSGLKVSTFRKDKGEAKYDLALYAAEQGNQLQLRLIYKENRYDTSIMEGILQNIQQVTKTILNDDQIKISQIELNTLKPVEDDIIKPKISEKIRIKEVVQRMPEKVAVEYGETQVSYLELERITNQIASFLQKSIGLSQVSGNRIVLFLRKSPELVMAMLGVLKTGGVIVPLDQKMPDSRLDTILCEVETDWIITTSQDLPRIDRLMKARGRLVNVLLLGNQQKEYNCSHVNLHYLDEKTDESYEEVNGDKCYIFYTSGSTGQPKGILGSQHSLKQFLIWEIKEFAIDESFRVGQFTSPAFDAILRDIFVPLIVGGTVCIPEDDDIIFNSGKLVEWIDSNQINLLHMVPSLFKHLQTGLVDANCFEDLQYVMLAGEQLRGSDIKKFVQLFKGRIQIVNFYGATETTLIKAFYRIVERDIKKAIIPVGRGIKGAQLMVLNTDQQICGPGMMGEIYIQTPFMTYGYYKHPELTAEVFLQNPFTNKEGDLVYKTGDLGRVMANGNVQVVGRIDYQVKIRGVRIEPGEIENKMLTYDSLTEVIVLAREDEMREKYLCAYFTADQSVSDLELREYLVDRLPEYMLPTHFVQLAEFPMTTNGKIDRKSLPDPLEGGAGKYVAPTTPLEVSLAKIWKSVLSIEKVGIRDNFFAIGGHSIKAMAVISKVYKELNVEVSLIELFKSPTIEELARLIENAEQQVYAEIKPIEEREYYPLSSAQKRVFVLNQMSKSSHNYNMPVVLLLEGKLDLDRLEQAFIKLIQRHESLRTSFTFINNQPMQKIHPEVEFKLGYRRVVENQSIDDLFQEFIRPFNLSRAPLLRAEVVELAEERFVLMYDMHHIISDGTSSIIMSAEFMALFYGESLPPLKIQYKDFAAWQNQFFESDQIKAQAKYWLKTFEKSVPALDLPTDFPRPAVMDFAGERAVFRLGACGCRSLRDELHKLALQHNVTFFMVLLAVYNILLMRYSGQEDVVVGTPTVGRNHEDLQKVIGIFVNTLALRNYPVKDYTFSEFLADIKENTLLAFENQDYQFEMLIDELKLERDLSRNPLFDTMLIMQNYDRDIARVESACAEDEDRLKVNFYHVDKPMIKFDLSWMVIENNEEVILQIEYSTRLFTRETIERMFKHFTNIAQQLTQNDKVKLGEIDLLDQAERVQLIEEFNQTEASYPAKTIVQLFEEQVERNSSKVAVVLKEKSITYGELNRCGNQLARRLRSKGVRRDSIVVVMVERSVELVIGMLGVIKAGGGYLPIDPTYPDERIEYMLSDSDARFMLTEKSELGRCNFTGQVFDLTDETMYMGEDTNLELVNQLDDLLYIIYTSGSTGKAKGVMIEHRNLVRLLFNDRFQFDFSEKDVWTMFHSPCFDFSVWEMYGALLYGGKLVIIPRLVAQDAARYLQVLRDEQVTVVNQTPTAFYSLAKVEVASGEKELRVRYVIFGGEALNPAMLGPWKERYPETRLINMYGITETTVHVTYKEIRQVEIDRGISNIGRAIPTLRVYVLDVNLHLQPIGVAGELCVCGEGLARGYLNRVELTEEKFIYHPELGERLYRSGDLARVLANGELEYLGRIDRQVKIRGFRIELGEIENQLITHPVINNVVVIDKEIDGEKHLCAYFVCKEGVVEKQEIFAEDLRIHLASILPGYMIPTYFVQIDQIPMTSNGKVDRKLLPEVEGRRNLKTEYIAAENQLEERLVVIWSEALGLDRVGVEDNFFDLGGSSLRAISVISQIQQKIDLTVTLQDLFKSGTIRGLVQIMLKKREQNYISEDPYIVFNADRAQNLFCFPPIDGSGLSYQGLARYIESHAFYCFDFIYQTEPEDRVNKYIELILQIQPEGPYVLMGYSAGGVLAFEVARSMCERGYVVSDLILFDSSRRRQLRNKSAQRLEKDVQRVYELLLEDKEMASFLKIEQNRVLVMERIREYWRFWNSTVNTGMIKASIHLITSEKARSVLTEDSYGWQEATLARVYEYKGVGGHREVLRGDELRENVQIVRDIMMNVRELD